MTTEAHTSTSHDGTAEAVMIDHLRSRGALTLSLVAEDDKEVVGHVAFSPVLLDAAECGWYGLGPASVRSDRRGQGIGSTLIREGLDLLRSRGAKGCVVLGDPSFYARYGFAHCPSLTFADAPAKFFMAIAFGEEASVGEVRYHQAFYE